MPPRVTQSPNSPTLSRECGAALFRHLSAEESRISLRRKPILLAAQRVRRPLRCPISRAPFATVVTRLRNPAFSRTWANSLKQESIWLPSSLSGARRCCCIGPFPRRQATGRQRRFHKMGRYRGGVEAGHFHDRPRYWSINRRPASVRHTHPSLLDSIAQGLGVSGSRGLQGNATASWSRCRQRGAGARQGPWTCATLARI